MLSRFPFAQKRHSFARFLFLMVPRAAVVFLWLCVQSRRRIFWFSCYSATSLSSLQFSKLAGVLLAHRRTSVSLIPSDVFVILAITRQRRSCFHGSAATPNRRSLCIRLFLSHMFPGPWVHTIPPFPARHSSAQERLTARIAHKRPSSATCTVP